MIDLTDPAPASSSTSSSTSDSDSDNSKALVKLLPPPASLPLSTSVIISPEAQQFFALAQKLEQKSRVQGEREVLLNQRAADIQLAINQLNQQHQALEAKERKLHAERRQLADKEFELEAKKRQLEAKELDLEAKERKYKQIQEEWKRLQLFMNVGFATALRRFE